MARAHADTPAPAKGPVTPHEQTHIIRHEPPEKTRRYHELAQKMDLGMLTRDERRELDALVDESSELMLENARALLRHRDPKAYARVLAEQERRRQRNERRRARAAARRAVAQPG